MGSSRRTRGRSECEGGWACSGLDDCNRFSLRVSISSNIESLSHTILAIYRVHYYSFDSGVLLTTPPVLFKVPR